MELKIKEEFKKLIPPLTPDEYKQLETNCIEEGIRDAIITWNGYIIDGHNRYKIAQDWQLGFNTIEKAFESEEYVKEWMIINQFGRRNLSNYDRAKLGLELKEILEYKAKLKESLRKSIQQTKAIDLENIKPEQKAIVEILSGYKKRAYATPDKIYFIQNEDKVKIGVSNDVESRLKDIKKHIPDCHLIGYCAGGIDLEKQIHNSLNECKLHNEWFKLNDLSITLIKSFVENCDFSYLRKVNSYKEASEKFKIGIDTIAKVKKIEQKAAPEIKEKLSTGELTINQAYQDIKKEEKKIKFEESKQIFEKEIKVENINQIIIHGDSIEILKNYNGPKFDLLLSDPPYGMNFKSGWSDKNKIANDKIEDTIELFESVLIESVKHLKEDAHFYLFGSIDYVGQLRPIIEKYLILKNILIWDRKIIGMGDLKSYGKSFDVIYFGINKKWKDLNGTRDKDLLSFNRCDPNKMIHPTEKPIDLLEYLIKKSTNQGDLILEPFAGGGSTLLAAKNTNRLCTGIEIEKNYVDLIKTRI